MWSDNETAIDLLGFQHLIASVTSIVRDDSLSPATIGVFGDWGGGKSSLLKMVGAELKNDPDTLVLSFNGWLFEGFDDTKSALMGVILDEIAANRTLKGKGKDLLAKLMRRVNWFRVAGATVKYGAAFTLAGPAGVGLAAAADAAGYATQLKESLSKSLEDVSTEDIEQFLKIDIGHESRKAVREFRGDFSDLLEETKVKKLVVLIDDLDRCLPPAVIEILEAIKLFLFVENTAFVIGADERLVRYSVRRRFPELPGEVAQVASEYLEKLIQYPVRIPSLDSAEMETYINLLFTEKAGLSADKYEEVRQHVVERPPESLLDVRFNAGIAAEVLDEIPEDLKAQLSMAQRLAPVLSSGLKGNPRQCKRFLNTLIMRVEMAKSRQLVLKQRVLAKLMLLEYLQPEWFRALAEIQALGNGLPPELRQLEKEATGAGEESPAKKQTVKKKSAILKESADEVDAQEAEEETVQLSAELRGWLGDDWMKEWLRSSPSLSEEDLRPYFYFSRDLLGPMASAARRMTPSAQQALERLLHESDAQQLVGIRAAEKLSPVDAAAVYDALTERIEQEDDISSERSALPRIMKYCGQRKELLPQLLSLLGRLPVEQMPIQIPSQIVSLVKGHPTQEQAKQLLSNWAKQTNAPALAKTAGSALKRV